MFKRKISGIFLSLFLLVNILSSPAIANGASLQLNITPYQQNMSNWCWAATTQTICNYLGKGDNPTQYQICIDIYGQVINAGVSASQDKQSLTDFDVSTTFVASALSWSAVVDMIQNWYSPIKAIISWNGQTYNHDVVICGYNDSNNTVYYGDPGYGTIYVTSYKNMVSNSSWTWSQTLFRNK